MAEVINGIIIGKLGDLVYYKGPKGQQMCRKAGTIGKDRFANDPKFAYQRKNALEFARAGKAVKMFRQICSEQDLNLHFMAFARLQREMLRAIKADKINEHGQRNLLDGKLEILEGFRFTEKDNQHFGINYQSAIDRVSGQAVLKVHPFSPWYKMPFGKKPVHFKVYPLLVSLHLQTGAYEVAKGNVITGQLGERNDEEMKLTCRLSNNDKNPWFLLLAVEFFDLVSGTREPVRNRSYHFLSIAAVSTVES